MDLCLVQIVLHHVNQGIAVKSCLQAFEHRLGKVDGNRAGLGMDEAHERQEAAVAAAEIKHAGNRRRQTLEQCRLAFSAMRNRISLREIRDSVLGEPPEIGFPCVWMNHKAHHNMC
jgi:hypothetical protein